MSKKIQPTEPALKLIRDTGSSLPRVDLAQVQKALGDGSGSDQLSSATAQELSANVAAESEQG